MAGPATSEDIANATRWILEKMDTLAVERRQMHAEAMEQYVTANTKSNDSFRKIILFRICIELVIAVCLVVLAF